MIKLFSAIVIAAELIAPSALLANSRPGYSQQCFRTEYREEYIPGTQRRPGRVRQWTEQVPMRCNRRQPVARNRDSNSCIEGSLLGGLLGGALGGTLATQQNWIWSIPSGIAAGAVLGCEFDGG